MCSGRRKSEWGRWCARGKRQVREQQRVRHEQHWMTDSFQAHKDEVQSLIAWAKRVVFVPRLWRNCTALYVQCLWEYYLHKSSAGNPSIRYPASREMISDSVELCETAVCFLHVQLTGTNVLLPIIHKTPPEVDFENSSSPAKSESSSKPNRQCCTVLPTWQYCWLSLVWWMYDTNFAGRLSQTCVHLVTDLASLFIDNVSPAPESLVSVSPSVNLHWKSLLDLSLTWRSAFRSDQKENIWNDFKRTSRNSWCSTNEEDGSTHQAWNSERIWIFAFKIYSVK